MYLVNDKVTVINDDNYNLDGKKGKVTNLFRREKMAEVEVEGRIYNLRYNQIQFLRE